METERKRKLARTPRRPEPSTEASLHHFFSLPRAPQEAEHDEELNCGHIRRAGLNATKSRTARAGGKTSA